MRKRHGFGFLLYQLVQTVRLSGFAVVIMTTAVVIVYYILRFVAHLLHIK